MPYQLFVMLFPYMLLWFEEWARMMLSSSFSVMLFPEIMLLLEEKRSQTPYKLFAILLPEMVLFEEWLNSTPRYWFVILFPEIALFEE